MRLTGRLATNIDQMTKYQARDALAEMQKVFGGTKGRIVFTKDAQGNLTGASISRGLWSGIKAVFSKSYRDRLKTTEEDFGKLMAKAAGQDIDPKLIVGGLRNHRTKGERSQLESDPAFQAYRQYGMAPPTTYVEGQLTPGLLGAFDPSDKTQKERIEHATERLTGMMTTESYNLPDFMIALSDLHCAGHYFYHSEADNKVHTQSLTREYLTKAIKDLPNEQLKSLFKFINHDEFPRLAYSGAGMQATGLMWKLFEAFAEQEKNLETMPEIIRAFESNDHDTYAMSSVYRTCGKVEGLSVMAATISDIAEEEAAQRKLDARNEFLHQLNQMQDEMDGLSKQSRQDDDWMAEFRVLSKKIGDFSGEKTMARTSAFDQFVVRAALYGGDFRKASEDLKQNPQLIQPVPEQKVVGDRVNFFDYGIDASLVELVKNCPMKCAEELFGPIKEG